MHVRVRVRVCFDYGDVADGENLSLSLSLFRVLNLVVVCGSKLIELIKTLPEKMIIGDVLQIQS